MIDYCSHLLSKQRFLPTLNVLAAHFSFYFWLFRFLSIIVLDFFVSVVTDIFVSVFVFVNGICLNPIFAHFRFCFH